MDKELTRLTTCFLLVLFMFPTGLQAQEIRQYFRDWLAACRPDGYCSATAYDDPHPPSGIAANHILRVGSKTFPAGFRAK